MMFGRGAHPVILALLIAGPFPADAQEEAPPVSPAPAETPAPADSVSTPTQAPPPPVSVPAPAQALPPPASVPAPSLDTPEEVQQAVEQGHNLLLQDRLDEARTLLEEVVKAHPDHAQAWHWLGLTELQRQQAAQGIAALERAVQLDPHNPVLKFDLASAYEAQDRTADAERVYQGMVGDDTVGIEATYRLARLYMQDRPDQAMALLEKVQEAQAKAPARARDAAAQLDVLYRRKAQALSDDLEGGGTEAFNKAMAFGVKLVSKRRPDIAAQIFEAVTKAVPQQAAGFYWLARVQIKAGQLEQGLKNLEHASELAPDNYRLKLELGKAYDAAKRQDDAERTYKDIIDHAKEPGLVKEARKLYGLLRSVALFQAKDWAGALAIFESLLKDEPDDPRLLELKVQALEELGRHQEADPILNELLKRFPKDPVLRSRVAGIYERRGDTDRAREQYVRVLELQSQGEQARLALEHLGLNHASELLQQNKPEEALKIFESVLAIAPDIPAVNLGAGIAYHRLQRNAEAEAAFKKVLAVNPDNILARVELAQIYEATGRSEAASRAFEELERFTRTEEERKFLKDRLSALYKQEVERVGKDFKAGKTDAGAVASLGERLVRHGFNEEAVKLLSDALERAPNDQRLHLWLGQALLAQNQSDRGLLEIERSVELAPGDYKLMMVLADDYLRAGRGEDAERTLLEVIRRSGDPALKREAGRKLAMIRIGRLLQDKKYEEALAEYDKLLLEFPDDLRLMSDRGRVLLLLDRKEEAEKVFAHLLEMAPNDIEIRLGIAQMYRQIKEPERAEKIYDDLLERFPGLVIVRLERGRLYQETGRDMEALKEFGLALKQTQGTEEGKKIETMLEGYTRSLIQRGAALLNAGKADEALSFFNQMAEAQPNNEQLHYWLAQTYKAQKRYDLQAQELEKVVEANPDSVAMKRRLALAYIDAGNAAKAFEILNEVLKAFPYDSEMRLALGDLLEHERRHEEARKEYRMLLELKPAEEWRKKALGKLGLDQARAQAERGETEQAIATLNGLLAIVPDDPFVLGVLAGIYQKTGRLQEAEETWRKVLAAVPNDLDARLALARIDAATGKEAEAIKLYFGLASETALTSQHDSARKELDQLLERRAQQAVDDAGKAADTEAVKGELQKMGVENFALGGYDAAQKVFDYLAKQFPDDAEALYWLGRVYAEREEFPNSLVFMKRSVALRPEDPRFLLGLGQAYKGMEIYGQAEQTLEKARDLAPENADIRFALADLYERRGDGLSAEKEYARVLEFTADDATALRALNGLGLATNPDRLSDAAQTKALRIFEQTLSTPPRSVAARYYVAVIYQSRKRYEEAEAGYRSVLEAQPDHAGAILHLARLYADTGRGDKAIAFLEQVIGRGGDPRLKQEAQKQLAGLIDNRAKALTELLPKGQGDVREAKELSKKLLIRGEAATAAALMEAAAKVAPNDAEVQYLLGRANVDRGEFDAGIASLERSVKLSPPSLQVVLRLQLALAYERAGRLDKAVAVHRDLYEHATNPQLRQQERLRLALVRAKQLSNEGNNDAALQEYDQVLGLFPNDVQLLTERGQLLVKMGRIEEADRAFERAVALAPQNLAVRIRLAEAYKEHGDTAKMVGQTAAIIKINPFSPESQQAREMLGYPKAVELLKSGKLDEAQETFERLLTVLPKDPVTRLDLGRVYYQQHKYAEAEHILSEIVREYPNQQDAHFLLGNISEDLERRENAIVEFEKAVALSRQSVTGQLALKALESLYGQQVQEQIAAGQEEAAILGLVRQIRNDPDNLPARANLAILYGRKQKYDEALEQLRAMARLQPNNQAVYTQMGSYYAVTQRNAQAVEAYAYAISLDTDEEAANRDLRELVISLARQLLAEEKPFAAIRELTMLNDMGLGDGRSNFILGSIYRGQNRFAEAAAAFREAVRANPDNLIMRLNLAQLYELTNDYDLALLQYRQILRIGKPGDRIVEAARPRADALENRLALFSSQMQYGITVGDSNIEEQDILETGAINSNFSSSLLYNLGTNFWPTDNLNLRLDAGAVLVTNHSTQTDTFVPRIGLTGNLSYPDTFYSASATWSDIRSLMLDTSSGHTLNYSLTAGRRLRDTFELFGGNGKKKREDSGETTVERAPQPATSAIGPRIPAAETVGDNARLRASLLEVYRRQYPTFVVKQTEKPIRSYTVVRGDTLWDIATRFLDDPFEWRKLDQLNPQIVNPDLIYPGELVFLEPPQAAPLFQEQLDPTMMLEREDNIRKSVAAAMDVYRTGQTLMRQDKPGEATAWFKAVLDIVPDDPLTLLNIGVAYQREREYALAERAFLGAVAGGPENQAARLHLAELYEESGQPDQAILMDEEALRHTLSDEDRTTARAQLRNLYQRKADTVLEKAELSQQDIDVLLDISTKLLDLGSPAAETILKELLVKLPDDAEANSRLARVYLQLDKPQQALVYARNSVKLAPDDAHYLLTLAHAARTAGDYDQAESAYRALVAKGGNVASAAGHELDMMQAGRLEAAGKLRQAREAYVHLLAESPDDVSLLLKAARLSDRLDLPDDAVNYYSRAIALEPHVLNYRLELADAYLRRGQKDKAHEQLNAAMANAVSEKDRQAILDHLGFQKALAELRRDNPDKALAILRDIDSVMPDNALVQLNIGVAYQDQEKYPEAEAQFQKILDADPGNLSALLRLGMVYAETGRVDRAITSYEKVVSQGHGLKVSDRAQAALHDLEKRRLRTLTGIETEPAEPLIKTLQARLFGSTSQLPSRSITQTDIYGASASFYYPTLEHGNWIFSYTFNLRNNVDPLGTDYAFLSHELGLTWQTPMPNIARWLSPWFGTEQYIPGLTASLNLDYEMRYYKYFDTNYLNVLGRADRRRQTVSSITGGLTYRFPNIDQMSLYFNYTLGRTRSNLPVGIVFTPDGIPVAFQSSGLGDFEPNFASFGINFQF